MTSASLKSLVEEIVEEIRQVCNMSKAPEGKAENMYAADKAEIGAATKDP